MNTTALSKKKLRIGLLAGSGRFPIVFAEEARRQGHFVYGLGVIGMASDELQSICNEYRALPLARIGKAIRLFNSANVKEVVMAGKIDKRVLFQPWRILQLLPDWRTIHMWYCIATNNKKDDTLLLSVIREFERDGITFHSALDYCPELLVKHGNLTRKQPTQQQWKDIRFGWEIAKEMGRLDVGQTVVVNDTAVMAIEAIEGTDACIRRAGQLCKRGFTVVKVAKPQQDMRFDVPTIGVTTLNTMREAGANVLAIESDKTILLDQVDVIKLADKLGIAIVAVDAAELELQLAS